MAEQPFSKSVVIVAGGKGTRMNHSLPKQFIKVLGEPIIIHTIKAFLAFDPQIQIIIVLPQDHLEVWNLIQNEYLSNQRVFLALGGHSRFQSVSNGLRCVEGDLVAIHDAVRPCVSTETIEATFTSAMKLGSGIACVPSKDSLRKVDQNGISTAVDRSAYQIVQTPQTFKTDLIKQAFAVEEQADFTDDASVFERFYGKSPELTEGNYRNIKVTTPEDLLVASLFLENKKP